MPELTSAEWKQLLRLILAQRLEINAIESALLRAGALSDAEIKAIRTQAFETATAWSSGESAEVLKLIGIHSSANATMLVPPTPEK